MAPKLGSYKKDLEYNKFNKKGAVRTSLENASGHVTSVQHPLPTDGDSIYHKDINVDESNLYNFSGEITDFFDDLETISTDSTTNNPKKLMFWFKRTAYTSAIGLGCNDLNASFSNIKVELLGSGKVVRETIDLTNDNTKYNSKLVQFQPAALNGFILSFETSDTVCLSNITIRKDVKVDAQLEALRPDGEMAHIGCTLRNNLNVSINEYGDTPAIDAFDRLRVSEPFTIFDSKQLHDKQPLFWDEEIGGNATSAHSQVDANVRMSVTANSNDYAIRQTKQRFNYQAGKSQLILMTFYSPQALGATKRVGMFDGTGVNYLTPNNGIFFECNNELSWNICKDGTITERVLQENWNVDKLDGTGPSKITLDLDSAHILVMDFEWLGVGRVRVGFVIDGLIYYVHYFNHANNAAFPTVYMSSPNLPLRYSIETDGTTATSLDHICSTVMSEGGIEKTGVLRVVETATNAPVNSVSINQTQAVLAIRLKEVYKDVTILPESMSMMCTTNDRFRWAVAINPTIDGTVTFSPLENSAIEAAVFSGNNQIQDGNQGIVIASGFASSESRETDSALNTALKIGSTIAGERDTLVLMVTALSANPSIYGSLNFRELL
jgi:hypothetical protein